MARRETGADGQGHSGVRRGRLAVRTGLWLVAGSSAILLLAASWNLRLQRAQLTQLVSLSADRLAETIRSSTRDAMLRHDPAGLHQIIATIGAQQGMVRVRVFNKEGRVRTSTEPGEVGQMVDKGSEECYACHQRDEPLTRLERADRVRLFRDAQGRRVLGIIAPIHNEAQCGSCHAPGRHVLGVLDVQLSMSAVDASLQASERQLLAALAATTAAVALLAGVLLWRLVLAPVKQLELAMGRMALGDLSARVEVGSTDEMGRLGLAWNALASDLQRARAELQRWNTTLEERVAAKTAELENTHVRVLSVEKMASLGRLAAVVAHEINNPLTGIRTFARLLLRRGVGQAHAFAPSEAEAAEIRRSLEMIECEAARCGEIVRNLLLFSRSAPGRLAACALPVVMERAVLLLRHQAEMLNVSLELEPPPPDLPLVECNAAQVQQMLMALTMNALEATPPGGQVTLSACAADEGAAVALSVADTGCGIPDDHRSHIFEPFFTTKAEGRAGVGLGLAVVHGIVSGHHGRIDVRAREGSGTLVTVLLPIRQPEPAGDAPRPEEAT